MPILALDPVRSQVILAIALDPGGALSRNRHSHHRESQREAAAMAVLAIDVYASSELPDDDVVDYREAEPRPLSDGLRGEEGLEDLMDIWEKVSFQGCARNGVPRGFSHVGRQLGLEVSQHCYWRLWCLVSSYFVPVRPRLIWRWWWKKTIVEFIAGKMRPEFTGMLPVAIANELGDRLDAGAFSTVPATGQFHYEGKRFCHLDGVPAAWVGGSCDGVPVSLIVFK